MRPLLLGLLLACLWDTDTIEMERRRFPGVQELLAGKFTRHSRAYYAWRVADRTARLAREPGDPGLADDLAVGYEKLGRTDEGIALMRTSLARDPRRYETLANLGTFLVHAGRLEEGLSYLRLALEVNPDAHFARERIQIRVVEWVVAVRATGHAGEPLALAEGVGDFGAFLAAGEELTEEKRQAGLRGVAGMMFFGKHDHPVLLECLGQLLVREHMGDANRLAARALLKASYGAGTPEARAAYRRMAADALSGQLSPRVGHAHLTLAEVEAEFEGELAEGRAFTDAIAEDEAEWAAAGLDLDLEFRRKYYAEGRPDTLAAFAWWRRPALALGLLCALYAGFWLALRRRLRNPPPASPHRPRSFRLSPDPLGTRVPGLALLVGIATALVVGYAVSDSFGSAEQLGGYGLLGLLGGLVLRAATIRLINRARRAQAI